MESQIFKERYEKLNGEQQLAVNSIEGPVMVIAGPGTGKTEILAARICNILLKTDTQAGEHPLPNLYRCGGKRHAQTPYCIHGR